jgi:hypothetical protein
VSWAEACRQIIVSYEFISLFIYLCLSFMLGTEIITWPCVRMACVTSLLFSLAEGNKFLRHWFSARLQGWPAYLCASVSASWIVVLSASCMQSIIYVYWEESVHKKETQQKMFQQCSQGLTHVSIHCTKLIKWSQSIWFIFKITEQICISCVAGLQ